MSFMIAMFEAGKLTASTAVVLGKSCELGLTMYATVDFWSNFFYTF